MSSEFTDLCCFIFTPHLPAMNYKYPKFKAVREVQSLSFEILHQIINLSNLPSFMVCVLSSLRRKGSAEKSVRLKIIPRNNPNHQQSRA